MTRWIDCYELESVKNGENPYYSPEFDMLYKTISGLLNLSIAKSKRDSLLVHLTLIVLSIVWVRKFQKKKR